MIAFLAGNLWWIAGLLVMAVAILGPAALWRGRWPVLAVIAVAFAVVFSLRVAALETAVVACGASAAALAADAERNARADERAAAARAAAIDSDLHQERAHAQAELDDLRDGIERGAVVLRERFRCPPAAPAAVPAAAAGTGGRDAAAPAVLSAADEEFLVRLAAEADDVARQLKACQALVLADRQVNP